MRYALGMLISIPTLALAGALLVGILGAADAADVVIDQTSIRYSPSQPGVSDRINITVDVVFVDSEPASNGVRLKWGLCTDYSCEDYNTMAMEQIADDGTIRTFTATVGPFPAEDDGGNPYVDLRFTVEVEAGSTDSSADPEKAQSDLIEIYFSGSHRSRQVGARIRNGTSGIPYDEIDVVFPDSVE